jgi:hypothetical protein
LYIVFGECSKSYLDLFPYLLIKWILFWQHNVWLDDALDRAKQLYLSHYRAMPKSLERATAHRLMRAMFNSEERFIEPSPQAIDKLTLPVVREAVMKQLVPSNMEVCKVTYVHFRFLWK